MTDIGKGRTWRVERDGRVGPTIIIGPSDTVTLSMDFGLYLNRGQSLATAVSAVDQSGSSLTTASVALSSDKRRVTFVVDESDLAASTNYLIRCTATTTDATPDTLTGDGPLQTRA